MTDGPRPTSNDVLPVAVVIPCFNDGATVGEAVASVIDDSPAEIVIVNDGSTDPATNAVLDALESPRVRVIRQANTGLSGARMRGVTETTSPLIMALDADDCAAPGAVRDLVRAFEDDPALAVAWGDVERFGTAGPLRYAKAHRLDPWRISLVNELVASTMVRRSSLLEAGGWALKTPFEDWDLWMAMAERGMKGRHIGRVTLRYRVANPRMYAKALKRHDELVRMLEARHPELTRNRTTNRRASPTGRMLKASWATITWLPLPPRITRYLYVGTMWLFEPSRRHQR